MSAQQDLQELLRLITIVRKTPMLQAMGQVKALQTADLKSIKQIAEAPLETVQAALKDDKAARPLHNACKAALKRAASTTSAKRGAPDSTATATSPKRTKTTTNPFMPRSAELTPQEFEASLELPLCLDEERIANTVIETNRAPLVLAFAVEALRHTMPDQPLSSRLSLGQAVVSANSRSKAVSLGLNRGPSAEEEGWGEGQPRVKVLGREVAVLKRGGYEWRESATTTTATATATTGEGDGGEGSVAETTTATSQVKTEPHSITSTSNNPLTITSPKPTWSTSQPITLKDSTFIARATTLTDPSQRKPLIDTLLHDIPHLQTASHNAWAYRICPPRANFFTPSSSSASSSTRIREDSFDDGETGSGNLILRILREHGAGDNTLVVLTRWFGGTMLGPDRWRLMRDCVSGALAERLRKTGDEVVVDRGEALWGLDLEDARRKNAQVVGMPVHRPEGARGYLLRSFGRGVVEGVVKGEEEGEAEKSVKKPKVQTIKEMEAEKEENLGLLLGALRLVFESWAGHISAAELDRRAWSW
ncbi:hypothetical protein B0J18DRAFT_264072 [Chaetomium sp. MPI-SDFR-AT-0129]|nr:hypothetical protein B0J18DRAFT_264072 [Chaetomium sp. MPI-SDFR-AT-0129]